jgi:hypothetical protein
MDATRNGGLGEDDCDIEILACGCFGSRFYDMALLNSGVDVCLHERNKVGDEYDATNNDHEKPAPHLAT